MGGVGGASRVDICTRRACPAEGTETERVLNGEHGPGNIKGTAIKFYTCLR